MSFLCLFPPFFHFEILENKNRPILMDFEEYNKTEDCEFSLVYKCVNVKYDYGDLLEFEFYIYRATSGITERRVITEYWKKINVI